MKQLILLFICISTLAKAQTAADSLLPKAIIEALNCTDSACVNRIMKERGYKAVVWSKLAVNASYDDNEGSNYFYGYDEQNSFFDYNPAIRFLFGKEGKNKAWLVYGNKTIPTQNMDMGLLDDYFVHTQFNKGISNLGFRINYKTPVLYSTQYPEVSITGIGGVTFNNHDEKAGYSSHGFKFTKE